MASRLQALFIACVMVSLVCFDAPASAQSPPTDLTELNIEEILALHIIGRSGEEVEDPKRWSVGYRYIYVLFDGNRDSTETCPSKMSSGAATRRNARLTIFQSCP